MSIKDCRPHRRAIPVRIRQAAMGMLLVPSPVVRLKRMVAWLAKQGERPPRALDRRHRRVVGAAAASVAHADHVPASSYA